MSTPTTGDNKKVVYIVIGIIVVFAIGFWGGDMYGKGQAAATRANKFAGAGGASGQYGGARGGRGGAAGGFVTGTILSKDATSITVQLATGGSKIVFLSDSSTIGKSVTGTADDLTAGEQVMVSGAPNSDGSVTATSVQIRPAAPTTAPATTQ